MCLCLFCVFTASGIISIRAATATVDFRLPTSSEVDGRFARHFPRQYLKHFGLQIFDSAWMFLTPRSPQNGQALQGGSLDVYKRPSTISQFLPDQISVVDNTEKFIFRAVETLLYAHVNAFQCSVVNTIHFRNMSKFSQQIVFSFKEYAVIWKDSASSTSNPRSFVKYVQLFSDKKATTLTSSLFVA